SSARKKSSFSEGQFELGSFISIAVMAQSSEEPRHAMLPGSAGDSPAPPGDSPGGTPVTSESEEAFSVVRSPFRRASRPTTQAGRLCYPRENRYSGRVRRVGGGMRGLSKDSSVRQFTLAV